MSVYPVGLDGRFKDWKSKPDSWFLDLTEDDVKEFKEACREYNANVRAIHAGRKEILEESRSRILSLYSHSPLTYKKEINFLKKLALWYPSQMDEGALLDRIKMVKTKKEKEERESRQNEQQVMMCAQAILWLQAKGKVLGTDFFANDAVAQANDISSQEEITRRIQQIKESDTLIEFNGQNCDDCAGWDGESRRCDCGNRRVSWESGGTFLEPYVYGEAY